MDYQQMVHPMGPATQIWSTGDDSRWADFYKRYNNLGWDGNALFHRIGGNFVGGKTREMFPDMPEIRDGEQFTQMMRQLKQMYMQSLEGQRVRQQARGTGAPPPQMPTAPSGSQTAPIAGGALGGNTAPAKPALAVQPPSVAPPQPRGMMQPPPTVQDSSSWRAQYSPAQMQQQQQPAFRPTAPTGNGMFRIKR